MNAFFRLKILPWLPRLRASKQRPGAFTVLTTFMLLLFSVLGLSLICFSQIYAKLASYKKQAAHARFASENGIKQEFENIKNCLAASSGPVFLFPTEYEELNQDVQNQGTAMVERVLDRQLPLHYSGGWENLAWSTQTQFILARLEQARDYIKATYQGNIVSTGRLNKSNNLAKACLETVLQLHAGYLPLPLIPLLIGKEFSAQEKEEYLEISNISMESSSKSIPLPQFLTGEGLIPTASDDLVEKAFKIDIFRPQDLNASRLRQILGLPDSEEDIPPGVYLIQDDLGLGGVFVQGDLDAMILAIEEENQVIIFEQGPDKWILKYNPSLSRTQFITPTESFTYDLTPLGIIIVDGGIASLGGGQVEITGEVTRLGEEEIPCIRQGVKLTILSSEEVIITSHLIHQGVSWLEGIPYIKDSQSQLTIFSTGESITGSDSETSGISLAAEDLSELKVQASLTSGTGSITLEGAGKRIVLNGSLHTTDYKSNGNELILLPDDRHAYNSELLDNSPSTKLPLLLVSALHIEAWKEEIEES